MFHNGRKDFIAHQAWGDQVSVVDVQDEIDEKS